MDPSHPPAKLPSPFGYTFNADFAAPSEGFSTGAPPLLSETENQSLADFFNNTNPFHTEDYLNTSFQSKDALPDFDWPYEPPPTIHGVSTTVPDAPHSLHGFHDGHGFASSSNRRRSNMPSDDELRAASALFNNAQSSQATHLSPGVAYSNQNIIYDLNPLPDSSVPSPRPLSSSFYQSPSVSASHSHIPEQLAALLPNHAENGSIDASIAAQFAQVPQLNQPLQQSESHRPRLKRPYAFGSDNAFNPTGYIVSSPQDTEDAVTRRLMHDLHTLQPSTKDVAPSAESTQPSSPVAPRRMPIGLVPLGGDEADQSEDETSDDSDEQNDAQPTKKRRKSKHIQQSRPRDESVDEKSPTTRRKSQSLSRSNKARKASQDDNSRRKRKSPSASQKAQRENLTEEQKRSNHILSEQKRRNLIKHGFEELHDLVPELRNGGLSKSNVLMEAASFLEELIKGNRAVSLTLQNMVAG
ncbi:hypothetical protein AOQ84DRAFT_20130 [Glonium stellatum]|uniref:BHLH domain-containing protein n=1 Tax=Glonium stellatum TaxID=574774 RepID=A0A8E2JUE1_9PEZI|nr:hypothetical protein AOQ84DRAFT_20130 [Glonium stellatum]